MVIVIIILIVVGVTVFGGSGEATDPGKYKAINNLCTAIDTKPAESIASNQSRESHDKDSYSSLSTSLNCSISLDNTDGEYESVSISAYADVYSKVGPASSAFDLRKKGERNTTARDREYGDLSGVGQKGYYVYTNSSSDDTSSDNFEVFTEEIDTLDSNLLLRISLTIGTHKGTSKEDAQKMATDMAKGVMTKLQ